MVSKKQIANGVAQFIETSLIPSISDKQMKLVLSVAKSAMRKDSDMLDVFLETPLIVAVMPETEGMYDIKNLLDIIKRTVDDGEYFSITIPRIPLLMQDDKILRLTSSDIEDLMKIMFPDSDDTEA